MTRGVGLLASRRGLLGGDESECFLERLLLLSEDELLIVLVKDGLLVGSQLVRGGVN